MALHANSELVMIHWLKSISGLPSDRIATTLPEDFTEFVQVSAVAGVPDMDTFMQNSVLQLDVWGRKSGSKKPPWNETIQLAMIIKEAIKVSSRTVILPAAFNNVIVHQVIVTSDPRRISGDPADAARYSFDVRCHWIELPS